MIEKHIQIKDKSGLHLRPARALCTKALDYKSSVTFSFHDREYNAKSLLSILSACVQETDEIILRCSGPDEIEAMEVLSSIIKPQL